MLKDIFNGLFLCGGLICCMAIGPLILRAHVSHLEAVNRIEALSDGDNCPIGPNKGERERR